MNTDLENPYVGPRTFLKEESHLFFGREREAGDLIALVASEQLVLFCAQSGAGKSSLINTRLIPNLESKSYEVLPIGRVGGELQAGHGANNIFVYNLLRSLTHQELRADQPARLSLVDFLAKLNRNDLGYYYDPSPLPEIPESEEYLPPRRALIIDQFEELFSTHPEAWGKREDFFNQLAQAMQDDPYLWVVLVMREEYVATLDPYAHLLPGGLRVRYYMQRLGREAALKAIKSPVLELRPFAEGVAEKLVDDLCTIKVQNPDGSLESQPGPYAEPVQLQVVCYRLWERLPPEGAQISEKDLQEIGDVDQSLARYYEERVKAVAQAKNVKERLIREWFEEKLITAGGVRNLVPQEQGNQAGGIDDDVIQALQSDLVRAEQRGGTTWYELTHDRLVAPILENNEKWFNENLSPLQRQAALWKDQGENENWLLSGQALTEVERWGKDHQDELTNTEKEFLVASRSLFERERRAKRLTRLITFLGIVAIILAIFAYRASMNAERQARLAFARQLAAQSDTMMAEFPILSTLLAIEANSVTRPGEQNPAAAEEALRAALRESHGLPLPGHEEAVTVLAFSSDGRWLASGSRDQTIRLWDMTALNSSDNPRILRGHSDWINTLAFSADGHWLATGSGGIDDTVRLWDLTAIDPSLDPKILLGQDGDINVLAISPDGHWLAIGTQNGTAWLCDLTAPDPAQELIPLISQDGWIQTLAFSPDEHWLATGGAGDHASVHVWDLNTIDEVTDPIAVLPGHQQAILTLAFSIDGHWLATGSQDHTAQLWDLSILNSPDNPRVLRGHSDWVTTLAFSPDGHWLASGSGDGTAQLSDLTAFDPSANPLVLSGHTNPIKALAFSEDGHWLATGSEDNTVRLWDMHRSVPAVAPKVLRGHDDSVNALAFTKDGHWLATGSEDGSIRLWDQINTDPAVNPIVIDSYTDGISILAFSLDGRWLATGSQDGSVWLWDQFSSRPTVEPKLLPGHTAWIQILAFSADGHWLATGSGDHNAILWDLTAEDPSAKPHILRGHEEWINSLAFSADGHWLATGSADRNAILWDLKSVDPAANARILSGHQGEIYSLAFSPDGRWLVTGSADNTARLWDLNTTDPAANFNELRKHNADISAVAFSPDGHWLATASEDGTARLWDLTATDLTVEPKALSGHRDQIKVLAFSPDSHWLATGSWDGTARLWNLSDFDPSAVPKSLPGHVNYWVTTLAFSPDSRWLATGSNDETVRLWDLSARSLETNPVGLLGHSGTIYTLAFSPDGHWLATGGEDQTLRLWLVQRNELESLACQVTGRNLSRNEWDQFFSDKKYHKTCKQWSEGP
jgi:WD40 repeat protein